MNIEDLWFDLEQWLSKNCTELDGVLRAGASPNLIDTVERRLGVTFPDEVRAFYQCHDGQTDDSPGLFESFQFLSLAEVLSEWFGTFVSRVLNNEFHYCEDEDGLVEIEDED